MLPRMFTTPPPPAPTLKKKTKFPPSPKNRLYETCPWEERVVRRWIMEGIVAPRYPGADAPSYASSSANSGGGDSFDGGSGGIGFDSAMMLSKSISTSASPGQAGVGGMGSGGVGMGGGGGGFQQQQQSQSQQQQSQPQQPQLQQTEECPICFMHYLGVNRTTCCSKPLCTECYLQVREVQANSCQG